MDNVMYAGKLYNSINVFGDKVLIKRLTPESLRQVDGIFIPESSKYQNMKIGAGQIIALGNDAKTDYGVDVNDYVLYDYYSANGDNKDTIITKAENLIVKVSEEEAYKFISSGL